MTSLVLVCVGGWPASTAAAKRRLNDPIEADRRIAIVSDRGFGGRKSGRRDSCAGVVRKTAG